MKLWQIITVCVVIPVVLSTVITVMFHVCIYLWMVR